MDVEIRPIEPEEFEEWARTLEGAFGLRPTPEEIERERRVAEIDRCLAAFDGAEMVGCAGTSTFRLTVPDGAARAAGVTAVGVKPTHRRRGINTALMRRQLDDVHAAGAEPLAILYASEGGIYGRYGYGLASFMCEINIERERSAFVRGYHPSGRVRLLERSEALAAFLPVYDRARRQRPGMIELEAAWFAHRLDETRHHGEERAYFYAGHESEEGFDAYAVYHVKEKWTGAVPKSELVVEDLHAVTPAAYADMWRYCFDIDLVERITAWNRPSDEPLLHLLQEPARLRLTFGDGLWARAVEVPAALEARRYAAEGRIVLEVHDAFCPWNDGRYGLEGGPDGATCGPTGAEPDLVLTANDLGAAYLGGASFRQLHRAGRVEEERPGALGRADAMFAWDPAPWCSFMF